jgi:hypothetical protein
MATTTNYGWTTPDDTALVKDGASAIRSLGTAVDTTTKNLNPSTTLGDIEYRSSTANTNTRLGIGTTGQILTVAGGVPSWATASSGGMTLLNSGSTALSGLSTITINITDSTYTNLEIQINGVITSTSSCNVGFRLNGDTGSNYVNRYFRNAGASSATGGRDTGTICYFGSGGNSTGYEQVGRDNLVIQNYSSTGYKMMFGNHSMAEGGASTVEWRNILASWDNTAAITSFTYLTDTGTFTAGDIRVYGVK